jgi:hypothetical protein
MLESTVGMAEGRRLGAAEPETTSQSWKNRSICEGSKTPQDTPARPVKGPLQVALDATSPKSNSHPTKKNQNMKAPVQCL